MKILIVCLGNICRSPLAHAILNDLTDANTFVDSAGTSNYHINKKPDHRMITTAFKHGFNLNELRAKQFTLDDFENFDIIYAMDHSVLQDILKLTDNTLYKNKVQLFLDDQDVLDPYFGGQENFDNVFSTIHKRCKSISTNLNG